MFPPRSGRQRDDTKVDAVCSYKDSASLARFDREKLYQELSTMTNNVTKLGHYSMDRSSLYVDGEHPWGQEGFWDLLEIIPHHWGLSTDEPFGLLLFFKFDTMTKPILQDIAMLAAFPFLKSVKFLANFTVTVSDLSRDVPILLL